MVKKLLVIMVLVFVSGGTSLLAEEGVLKKGITLSYGGGFGYYTASYRMRMDSDRGYEFGVGIYPGIELERTFPGTLSDKDKPLKDYLGAGIGLAMYVNDITMQSQPHVLARFSFDGYHGPAILLGGGYEYYFGKAMNSSFLLELALGARFSKDNYVKDEAPNSKVEVGSTYYGQVRAGIGIYF